MDVRNYPTAAPCDLPTRLQSAVAELRQAMQEAEARRDHEAEQLSNARSEIEQLFNPPPKPMIGQANYR